MLQFLWISKKRVSVVVLSSTYHYHHLSSVPFCCTAVNNLPMGYPVLQQPPLPATHINSMSCSMSSSRVVKGIPASGNFHPIHMNAANEWEFLLISISSWLSFLFFSLFIYFLNIFCPQLSMHMWLWMLHIHLCDRYQFVFFAQTCLHCKKSNATKNRCDYYPLGVSCAICTRERTGYEVVISKSRDRQMKGARVWLDEMPYSWIRRTWSLLHLI